MNEGISRRDLFRQFYTRIENAARRPVARTHPVVARGIEAGPGAVAVIQGRFCLAYQGSFCSVCEERCPVPGAIAVDHGVPRVVTADCTGCGICREVCPAPVNAVLMIPKRNGGATPSTTGRP